MLRIRGVALGLGLWSLLVALPVLAQDRSDDERARDHFGAGRAYYEQARYEDAAREFMEAYRLSPRPLLLDNAARSYERALLFDEAIQTLEQLMARHPEHEAEATVRERIANLGRLRERVRGGGGGDPAPEVGATSTTTTSPPPSGGGGVSIPGITILAAGGALGLGAIITGAVSHSMFESVQAECSADGLCPAERQGDIDTGNALAITSTVLTFVSIAAMAAGVVVLIVDTGGGGEQARLEVTPTGLALNGSFQ